MKKKIVKIIMKDKIEKKNCMQKKVFPLYWLF